MGLSSGCLEDLAESLEDLDLLQGQQELRAHRLREVEDGPAVLQLFASALQPKLVAQFAQSGLWLAGLHCRFSLGNVVRFHLGLLPLPVERSRGLGVQARFRSQGLQRFLQQSDSDPLEEGVPEVVCRTHEVASPTLGDGVSYLHLAVASARGWQKRHCDLSLLEGGHDLFGPDGDAVGAKVGGDVVHHLQGHGPVRQQMGFGFF
mmetsp:Transcript_43972/g.94185  ORF Transcript_43972/g.94185 Transcript_43972/m.94185 type:complete len:205 (+) Transcript_43972:310-924(+)